MARNIIIKLAIALIVSTLVYCAFWFFKIGQVEKQINKFISDNSPFVSGEVSVSGFPASQKITVKNLKISLPILALDNNEIIVPHLEAKTGIFGSDYEVSLVEPASIQDIDGNQLSVEFTSNPEIKISIADGNIKSFSYKDSGYKILNADKTVAYSSSSNSVSINSTFEIEKTSHQVTAQISESEGFSLVDFYKNSLEKKIIDGIKTGEVVVSSSMPETQLNSDPAAHLNDPLHSAQSSNPAPTPAAQTNANPAAATNSVATTANVAAAPTEAAVAQASPNQAPANAEGLAAPNNQVVATDGSAAQPIPATDSSTKNMVTISFEYVITPIKQDGQANTPPDPTQIQQAPLQNNKTLKIENIEISNPMFTISINGEMTSLPDDNLPSGGITVKIDKMSNLVTTFVKDLAQIAEKLKTNAQLQANIAPAADNSSPTAAPTSATPENIAPTPVNPTDATQVIAQPSSSPVEDPYQVFLTKVAANLEAVSKEIAAKNAATKDDVALFDIRREKNLDFLINETPTREVLGKF